MAAPGHSDRTRPLCHEIESKARSALAAIAGGRRVLGLTKHLFDDFTALGVSSEAELWKVLAELLEEIIAAQPAECYAGGHPPYRSYDEEMKNLELWPYRWMSPSQGKMMFLKFALKRDRQGNWVYVHVDVHEDRPKRN